MGLKADGRDITSSEEKSEKIRPYTRHLYWEDQFLSHLVLETSRVKLRESRRVI